MLHRARTTTLLSLLVAGVASAAGLTGALQTSLALNPVATVGNGATVIAGGTLRQLEDNARRLGDYYVPLGGDAIGWLVNHSRLLADPVIVMGEETLR